MSYDVENRLATHNLQGFLATYSYDGDSVKRVEFTESNFVTLVWDGSDYLQAQMTPNNYASQCIFMQYPPTLTHSAQGLVTILYGNVGNTTWTQAGGIALGSQAPAGNSTWGMSSVAIGGSDSVAQGQSVQWAFHITAPSTAGNYALQWQVTESGAYFGELTDLGLVQVI